jgi:hypothetical protein
MRAVAGTGDDGSRFHFSPADIVPGLHRGNAGYVRWAINRHCPDGRANVVVSPSTEVMGNPSRPHLSLQIVIGIVVEEGHHHVPRCPKGRRCDGALICAHIHIQNADRLMLNVAELAGPTSAGSPLVAVYPVAAVTSTTPK